jgi:GNAT superfamily N-acetyltransferase
MDVLTLGTADVERAGAVIARAFYADPLNVHLYPDERMRTQIAPSMFTAYVRLDQMFGQVDHLPELQAVASWVLPGEAAETPERLAEARFDDLPAEVPLDVLETVFGFIGSAVAEIAPEPHWHLRLLGVEPGLQGGGLGALLVQHGLRRAAAGGHPVMLETFSERNLGFYARSGFELLVDDVEPISGVRFWALRHPG